MIIPKDKLSLEEFISVTKGERIKISKTGIKRVKEGREALEKLLKENIPIYGVNTGFGALCDKKIENRDLESLQKNLILSHALGGGEIFDKEIVRGAMFLRANTLSKGFSGVRLELVNFLLELLNRDIIPVVYKKGSVGASGDLLPLAQIGLTLLGKGEVFYKGRREKAAIALKKEGLAPIKLEPKEGLSLINGTEISTSYLGFNLYLINRLFSIANLIATLSFYAGRGDVRVLDLRLHRLKPYSGQLKTTRAMKRILGKLSSLSEKVQDPYSLRCIPQVHGAVYEGIRFANEILKKELNAVTDNPLILSSSEVLTGGNFHAQAISLAGDILSIVLTTLSLISERRIFYLLSGPPLFLISDEGKNSGLMMAQVLAASLASENKTLSFPASVTSLPTSLNQEDFVSMSINSLTKMETIRKNLEMILAIEGVVSAQGIEVKNLPKKGIIGSLCRKIREFVPFLKEDKEIGEGIRKLSENLYILFKTTY